MVKIDNGAEQLARKSNEIRNHVLEMCYSRGGHLASSFSCVEILVSLYYGGFLRVTPGTLCDSQRDRFILSKGHGETVLYAVLADRGFFPTNWLKDSYRHGSCLLGGHPDHKIPGVEITSGALGHGLGIGAGMAYAAKMDGKGYLSYVLMGDAECTEGSVWEAAIFAAKHCLGGLIAIVDRNQIGSLDFTENYTQLEPFRDKWQAFGWETVIVNGHSFSDLLEVWTYVQNRRMDSPLMVIAETIKGKGLSFVENDPRWHVLNVSSENIEAARKELRWQDSIKGDS